MKLSRIVPEIWILLICAVVVSLLYGCGALGFGGSAPGGEDGGEAAAPVLEIPGLSAIASALLGPWAPLVLGGAALFAAPRSRGHLVQAGKSLAKLEPKEAVLNVARAAGLAHSSEASKAAAGGATVTSAGMTIN